MLSSVPLLYYTGRDELTAGVFVVLLATMLLAGAFFAWRGGRRPELIAWAQSAGLATTVGMLAANGANSMAGRLIQGAISGAAAVLLLGLPICLAVSEWRRLAGRVVANAVVVPAAVGGGTLAATLAAESVFLHGLVEDRLTGARMAAWAVALGAALAGALLQWAIPAALRRLAPRPPAVLARPVRSRPAGEFRP